MEPSLAEQRTDTVEVLVVSSPACHFCEGAIEVLGSLSREFPLVVKVVDIRSEEGNEITRAHRFALSPGVLVDGEFFSSGRLPEKKLRRLLSKRVSA